MKDWLKSFKIAWFFAGIGAMSIIWLFTHFTTKSEAIEIVNQAKATETRVIKYVDEKDQNVNTRLDRLETVLNRIDVRIDHLYKKGN